MKHYLVPILIITVAGLLGVGLIFNQKINSSATQSAVKNNQNLRLLSFKAPGMFCLGCSASMEGYLGSIDGVRSVNASLSTKQVEVVYDSTVTSKEVVLSNQILDAYGKEQVSDEEFVGGDQVQTPSTTNLPQSLAFKLQEAAAKVAKLENQSEYQAVFTQIDEAIADQNYQKAEDLLDGLLLHL